MEDEWNGHQGFAQEAVSALAQCGLVDALLLRNRAEDDPSRVGIDVPFEPVPATTSESRQPSMRRIQQR